MLESNILKQSDTSGLQKLVTKDLQETSHIV